MLMDPDGRHDRRRAVWIIIAVSLSSAQPTIPERLVFSLCYCSSTHLRSLVPSATLTEPSSVSRAIHTGT
jgi:hypothetical protein